MSTRTARASRPGSRAIPHFTPAERAARGRAARADVPRSSHADWAPAANRRDPVEILEEQAVSRVQDLVPIRYGRMLTSAFAFYRGAAAIMAADLAPTPRSGLRVQLCGDAHLSNFGVFASPERDLVFDLNDFDETLPGPWEWDVKRLAASFAIGARESGVDDARRRKLVQGVVGAYRTSMAQFATMPNLQVWYARLDMDEILRRWRTEVSTAALKTFDRNVAKARAKDSMRAFSKLTRAVDGKRRIVSDPPLIVPVEDLAQGLDQERLETEIRSLLRSYRRTLQHNRRHLLEDYRYVHMARKVVGVGSVGTRAWIVLLLGRDEGDPLFLQAKEAEASVLEPYVGASDFANHGQRVVEGQRMMQAASDIFLGWQRVAAGLDGRPRDFYVRQLWDAKASPVLEAMSPRIMAIYAQICGWTLARAHARSGDRMAIAAYLGTSNVFDRAIEAFAEAYADQNERDYEALTHAVRAARVAAATGL
jgi:uncharacterized protein (DUF2252 family)